jgi:hypothetical protein
MKMGKILMGSAAIAAFLTFLLVGVFAQHAAPNPEFAEYEAGYGFTLGRVLALYGQWPDIMFPIALFIFFTIVSLLFALLVVGPRPPVNRGVSNRK